MTERFANATAAKSLLGPQHPLTTALNVVATATKQLAAVAAAGGAGLLANAAGSTTGRAVALAAGCVAIILGVRLLVVLDRARDRARDAIIAGQEDVPVAVVRRQRERLLRPHVRNLLAGMYDDLAHRAEREDEAAVEPAATSAGQRLALARDFRHVAHLLRRSALDARVVALAEWLLEDRTSPLYGADIDTLRRALGGIQPTGSNDHEALLGRAASGR